MKKTSTAKENIGGQMDNIDRRSFVKFMPALGAGLITAKFPSRAPAQVPAASPTPTPSPTPSAPSPLAEAYVDVTRVRFGDHVQAAQWDQIKRDLEGNVRNADRLRGVKLQNGDEPDFIFVA